MDKICFAIIMLTTGCIFQGQDKPDKNMKLGKNIQLDLVFESDELRVIFKNTGKDTCKIWQFNNPYGWGTLSLAVKSNKDEEKFFIKKRKNAIWTKTGPGAFEILPGSELRVPVNLSENVWKKDVQLLNLKDEIIYVKAILEIPADEKTKLMGILTGKIESNWHKSAPPHNYLF